MTPHAFAWGNLGHQAIGEAAQSALSAKAQEGLGKVFGHGAALAPGTLAKVATWPDEIRSRNAHGAVSATWDQTDIDEADKFNRAHKTNSVWHFVNLPLDASGYPGVGTPANDPLREFARPDDIVQAMKQCIDVLEAPTASGTFTKVQAVRWLVHLVGDIHQPADARHGRVLQVFGKSCEAAAHQGPGCRQ